MAAVWAASATTGARVADVLDRLAHGFTAEDDSRADLDALAAGPRATATVLCLLPLGGIALATVMGADPLALLLRSALGGLLLAVAALLDVCGVLWVRAVTARALRG
jgi:tight adherence protein B